MGSTQMLSTETLHKDVVYCCKDLVGKGLSWPEIESMIWMRYIHYAITYASEIHCWIEEAKNEKKVLEA